MKRALLPGLLAASLSVPAFAGTEEFSTFDAFAQEEDDESLLDHLLTRPPRAWRDEWERAPQAVRTSQGCLTSGQWFIATHLRLRAPLGRRAHLGVAVRDDQSDRAAFTYFDFSFLFPTGSYGAPGLMYRPLFDKSRQDLALFWEAGAETTATWARATFTFEDIFNNLWAFRQTRVGRVAEPYERHPFEPALWLRLRGPRGRFEAGGQYLTPSRRRLATDPTTRIEPRATLWGTFGHAALEVRALGLDWELRGEDRQAKSERTLAGSTSLYGGNFRRQWAAELAARRAFTRRLEGEARWLYQGRSQRSQPPFEARFLDAVDRVIQVEGRYAIGSAASASLGLLRDRITVAHGGYFPSYGSRTESRAYLGLAARFGRVSVHVVEGLELDPEPYEVWWIHDKAFLHLQTTF